MKRSTALVLASILLRGPGRLRVGRRRLGGARPGDRRPRLDPEHQPRRGVPRRGRRLVPRRGARREDRRARRRRRAPADGRRPRGRRLQPAGGADPGPRRGHPRRGGGGGHPAQHVEPPVPRRRRASAAPATCPGTPTAASADRSRRRWCRSWPRAAAAIPTRSAPPRWATSTTASVSSGTSTTSSGSSTAGTRSASSRTASTWRPSPSSTTPTASRTGTRRCWRRPRRSSTSGARCSSASCGRPAGATRGRWPTRPARPTRSSTPSPSSTPTWSGPAREYLATRYAEDPADWGRQDARVWTRFAAFLQDAGMVDEDVDVEAAFTNDLL